MAITKDKVLRECLPTNHDFTVRITTENSSERQVRSAQASPAIETQLVQITTKALANHEVENEVR